jgi:hypothetical protein
MQLRNTNRFANRMQSKKPFSSKWKCGQEGNEKKIFDIHSVKSVCIYKEVEISFLIILTCVHS